MPYVSQKKYQKLVANRRENRDLRRRLKAAEREATIDALTGLHRRSVLDRALEREVARRDRAIMRQGCVEPLTLLFIDIDHFKQVNDQHGHQIGDAAIAGVAQVIQNCLRAYDLAVRWGGEEFAVLLPATDIAGATAVADRIRQSVLEMEIWAPERKRVPVAVSIGVADATTSSAKRDDITVELLRRADQALYTAKHTGRNRVCLAAA